MRLIGGEILHSLGSGSSPPKPPVFFLEYAGVQHTAFQHFVHNSALKLFVGFAATAAEGAPSPANSSNLFRLPFEISRFLSAFPGMGPRFVYNAQQLSGD